MAAKKIETPGAGFKPIDIKSIDPRVQRQHVRNIMNTYRDAPAETIRQGRDWYPRAHDIAQKVGRGDARRGAGMIAALSPNQDWDLNIAMAHQMSQTPLRGHQVALLEQKARQHAAASQAVYAAERAAGGSRKAGKGLAPAHLYEAEDAARREHHAVRADLFGGTPLNKQSSGNILRAESIRTGQANPEDVLPMRVKTGNFYRNVLDPSDPHSVTVDTHAHDIAINRKLPWETDRGLSAMGRYDHFADSYRRATHGLDESHAGTVQAVTWSHWRNLHGRARGA